MPPLFQPARAARVALLVLGLVAAGTLSPAHATRLLPRTYVGSATATGAPADGASADPALSSSGRVLAFDTAATDIAAGDANGSVRDVVTLDLATNERILVSTPPGQAAADGPSNDPVLSANGQRVAFVSAATNLVPGDTNGVPDVFLRQGRDPLQLVSVGAGNAPANAPSSQPDISADGTRVAFTSAASNLVPGDTNGQRDVFVRDLRTGTTTRVSVGSGGQQANSWSSEPAISANGRFVAFTSAASNLVSHDTNGIMDVFLHDLRTGHTIRVSVNTAGRQQNRSVQPPFVQIPDVSDDGTFVVFDSDATNLYKPDRNKHTDVFLRDVRAQKTTLISANSVNVQGNNDSFAPQLAPKSRFVTFESFATNLAFGDGPREDIFVRDLKLGTTNVVNVTANGAARGPEQVRQLLQRPAVSSDGRFAAFSSTVTNLVSGDTNGVEDVFIRLMDPPTTQVLQRPVIGHGGLVRLAGDDPEVTNYLCNFNDGPKFVCAPSFVLHKHYGRTLTIRAGGPGMLYDEVGTTIKLSNDRRPPRIKITALRGGSAGVLRGRAMDASGVAQVFVGVSELSSRGCRHLTATGKWQPKYRPSLCPPSANYILAHGTSHWRLRLPRAVHGPYLIYAVAIDRIGNRSGVVSFSGTAP